MLTTRGLRPPPTPTPQHVCADCKENYCGCCSAQTEPSPRLCHTCRRFHGNLLQRAELMKLKVKELRDYLHLHRVATHLCREKVRYATLRYAHLQKIHSKTGRCPGT